MKLLIVDTETGGLNPDSDALLSIGAIAVENTLSGLSVKDTFHVLINPNPTLNVSSQALATNKLSLPYLKSNGEPEREALLAFYKFASQHRNNDKFPLLLGWNLQFDIDFLKAAVKRTELAWPFYFISLDVAHYWKSYRIFEKQEHAFGGMSQAAREFLNEDVKHDALEDCKMTLKLLSAFVGREVIQ